MALLRRQAQELHRIVDVVRPGRRVEEVFGQGDARVGVSLVGQPPQHDDAIGRRLPGDGALKQQLAALQVAGSAPETAVQCGSRRDVLRNAAPLEQRVGVEQRRVAIVEFRAAPVVLGCLLQALRTASFVLQDPAEVPEGGRIVRPDRPLDPASALRARFQLEEQEVAEFALRRDMALLRRLPQPDGRLLTRPRVVTQERPEHVLGQHVVLLGEGFRQPQRCPAVAASESCDQIVARAGRRWDGEAEQHEKEDYVVHGISPGRGSGSPLIVSPTNRTHISLSFIPWPTAKLAITPTAKASR